MTRIVDYPAGTHRSVHATPQADPAGIQRVGGIVLGANKLPEGVIPKEGVEAAQLIQLCTGAALAVPDLAYLVHTPNGGLRSKSEAARMSGEGVRAGYPDYTLDVSSGGFNGWKGELKRIKYEYPTPKQYEWLERLRACGYWANWHRGAETMFNDLLIYLALRELPEKSLKQVRQAPIEQKPQRAARGKGKL